MLQIKITTDLSCRAYRLLLIAYPSAFRREYGHQMQQVFRDCYRNEARRKSHLAIAGYWVRTLLDLVTSAAKEHSENFRREQTVMSTLRRDIVSVVGCIAIISSALALLNYGKTHEVRSILIFGYWLDAVVTAGVVGNLIVFLLVKTTRWHPLRIALWSFVAVHAALTIVVVILGLTVDSHFRFGPILVAWVLSFLFWFGVHWAWQLSKTRLPTPNA